MPGIEFFVSTLFPSWYKNVETAESQSASAANTLMIIRVPNSYMHVYMHTGISVWSCCMIMCICVCMSVYTNKYMYACTFIHICMSVSMNIYLYFKLLLNIYFMWLKLMFFSLCIFDVNDFLNCSFSLSPWIFIKITLFWIQFLSMIYW